MHAIPISRGVPQCETKARLMNQYTNATSEFSRTLKILNTKLGVMQKKDYEAVRNFVETARVRSETARLALERHVQEHGC